MMVLIHLHPLTAIVIVLAGPTPPPLSNIRFYAHRSMVAPPPSRRHPGSLADWWPRPFNQQVIHLHGSRPQILPWTLAVCLCWCSWTCVWLCVVLICKGGIVVMDVCLRQFCLAMRVGGHICLFWVGPGFLWGVLFRSDVRWVVWCLWFCCCCWSPFSPCSFQYWSLASR